MPSTVRSSAAASAKSEPREEQQELQEQREQEQQQEEEQKKKKKPQNRQQRSFWYCFAALQLCLCASVAPLCWLTLSLARQLADPPLGAAPSVIVTSVGTGLCLASVGLLCTAQCTPAGTCLTWLLWLRIFSAGSCVCAALAAAGLLLHSAAQVLSNDDAAAFVATLAGLAAANASQAAAACVHIYNCVTAVQLSWRVATDEEAEDGGGTADDRDRDHQAAGPAWTRKGRKVDDETAVASDEEEQRVEVDEYL